MRTGHLWLSFDGIERQPSPWHARRSGVRIPVAPPCDIYAGQSHISTVMPVSEGVPRPDRISSSLAVCAGQRHHRSPCAVSKRSGILSGISAGQRAFPAPPGTRCPSSRTSCSCSSSRRRAVRPPAALLERRHRRTADVDPPTSQETIRAQVAATLDWRQPRGERYAELASITQPALIVNRHHDIMCPTINSYILAQHMPSAELIVYPDSRPRRPVPVRAAVRQPGCSVPGQRHPVPAELSGHRYLRATAPRDRTCPAVVRQRPTVRVRDQAIAAPR